MGGQGGKVLRIGLSTPVAWLDPRQASDASSHMVLAQVFEAPYAQAGPEADPEPRVMASLLEREERGAGAIYSAPVRPGLLFSDGTPVGPDHVVESLRRVGPLREVSLSTRGDRVLFTLERPIAGFEFQLSKRWCMVALERGGRYYGTGPFMVESVGPDPQGMIRLVRNPHHRHPVALDAIEFRVYPPAPDGRHDALLAAVESGEVHFTAALPRDEVGRLGQVRKLFQPGNSTAMLYFNTERGVLADAEVRRALALALDRYQLARVCHPDSPGLAARALLPPNMGSASDGIRPDPRRAKEMLDAVGIARPLRLRTVMVWGPRPYMPHPALVVQELNRQMGELGVSLDQVETRDAEDYFAKLSGGDYDAVLGGWIADSEDPADFMEAVLTTEFIPIPGRPTALTANLARWDDAETNRLVRSYRRAPSQEGLQAALARVAEEVPLLPLSYGPRVIVHSREVRNFDPTPVYVPTFAAVDLD